MLLSVSNLVAGSLCAVAIVLITTLGRRRPATAALAIEELPTQEFAALRDAVLARDPQPRTRRARPARR